jgi:hypothetical protein
MPIIRCYGSSRPSIFVESSYLFDAESAGEITTYLFDPASGEWKDVSHNATGTEQSPSRICIYSVISFTRTGFIMPSDTPVTSTLTVAGIPWLTSKPRLYCMRVNLT